MVVAAPATMEEGRILLVGNESDILHSAFTFPINQGGKRYPSADHYAHAQILTQLGLDEVHILELLATSSVNVSRKARELLVENMPPGHDMNSLSQYLTVSRQSYTMMGLRLRAEQDKRFRQTLMETGDALLIVCDRRDTELGIGMDDETFVAFARRRHANAERISGWMHDERQRPKELGQNQLGFFLMWLRYELREKEKAKWLSTVEIKAAGLSSRDEEEDKPVLHISISDFVLALQGPFQPLSNYYALTFELKGCTYRSVEHYAYQRLFEALHLSEEEIMKIRTTVKPVDVAKFAKRLFARLQVDPTEVEHKSSRLDRWRQSAMKYKITKSDYLQKLLLSTGHALLLETTVEADPQWSCGTDEFEFQHLLTKRYISAQQLVNWQCGRAKLPPALAHLGGNKTGLLLMELRAKMAGASTHRMPLIAPLASSVLRSSVSNHMICFSPESVLHPFYPADIRLNDGTTLPSAAHLAAQMAIRFLNVNPADADWIMEPPEGPECWERLHTVICHQMQLPLEKIQQWYMEERQLALKEAMKLQFDQNPALLRVLLDTQDALLVSCARFSSVEAELNIGVRERDLRLWLSQVQQDSKQLMDLCLRPMAFRPPYFGGNRLGILLMELRREFILAGVFPHQLPELAQPVDALLGSESPMENYAVIAPFDVLDEANFAALWANPYLLMLKQQLEAREGDADTMGEQWEQAAMSRKPMPLLISRDEPQIASIFERLFLQNRPPIDNGANGGSLENGDQQHTNGGAAGFAPSDPTVLDELSPEMLRSVYIKMASQFRHKLGEMDELHKQIGIRSRDSGRLQDMRRMLERNREHLKQQQNAAENPAAVAQLQQQQAGAGGIAPPPPLPQLQQQQQQQSAPDSTATEQQMQSSAQWTQAAAMSAGGGAVRRHSPPTADQQQQQQQPFIIGSRAEMTGNGGGGGQAAASTISAAPTQQPPPKIPSLLPELFASPQQQQQHHQMQQQQQQAPPPLPLSAQYHHHPPPHHQMAHGGSGGGGGRMPLPPQLSTTQQTYGSGGRRGDATAPPTAYGDRRPARWERPISSRRGSGRRGGGGGGYFGGGDHHHSSGGGGGSRRSQSPTSYGGGSGRRRASRSPPPPRHHRAPAPYHKGAASSSSAGHRAETTSRERTSSSSRRGSATDATSTSGGGQQQPQPAAAVEAAPPAVKKPKRVVDQSELSEGEILSDEDE